MKSYKSRSGPFNERPYFSDKEIENICADELRSVGLMPAQPEPIRIDRFIEKRFKVVPSYADLGEGILGLTKFSTNGVMEVIVAQALEDENSTTGERRIRSTLAHEAGHCLFHAHLFALAETKPLFADHSDANLPKVLCRDADDQASYNGKWWEFQANRAIGGLLMPRQLVEVALAPFMKAVGGLGLRAFDEARVDEAARALATTFNVNPAVARIRIGQVGKTGVTSGQLAL